MAIGNSTRTGPESDLREAIITGRLVDLSTGHPDADDPAHGAEWDEQRTVRAEALVDLLTQTDGTYVPRALRLSGARITGALDLEAAELICPVLLRGCWFELPVNLAEASAPGLRLSGCHVSALHADRLTTRGNLQLDEGFTAEGGVYVAGAHIGGQLGFDGARLTNVNGPALIADRLAVEQGMFCSYGFVAEGEVYLLGAHIGGDLDFTGAKLTNVNGPALIADRLTVDQGMFCRDRFVAEGEVRLAGARIGGRLDFTGAKLTPDRPEKDGWILDLGELKTGTLFLRGLAKPPEGVDLTQAQVDTFIDDAASWPHLVVLRGFTYGVLHEQPRATARMRLTWLRRDPEGYTPQPYEQLASVYRRAGRERDARTVEFANQRARRHELSLASRLSSLDALVGYGYRPWQPLVWLLGWWIAGALVFTLAYPHHMTLAKPGQPHHTFQPAVYALDVLLPVIDFEQQGSWIPEGAVRWWAWASIVAGWVLVTAFIAALTGALRRE